MDNGQKNLAIIFMAGILWLAAVYVLLDVVKTVECHNWQNRPLDTVPLKCIR